MVRVDKVAFLAGCQLLGLAGDLLADSSLEETLRVVRAESTSPVGNQPVAAMSIALRQYAYPSISEHRALRESQGGLAVYANVHI